MKNCSTASAVSLAVVLCAGLFHTPPANAQSGTRRAANESFEARFWRYLQTGKYKNWAPAPGQTGGFYPGESPHGAKLKMYLNRVAAGNSKKFPLGSIVVKENYSDDEKLMAITVMYRAKGYDPDHNDWYWVKYNPDGSVAKAPPEMGSMSLAGKVKGCIMCHEGADGDDYAFIND